MAAEECIVTRKRGPYKLYNLNPEDENYNATVPRTTKWRRLRYDDQFGQGEYQYDHHNDRDSLRDVEFDENADESDDQHSTASLQSQCSNPSFNMSHEDEDVPGENPLSE